MDIKNIEFSEEAWNIYSKASEEGGAIAGRINDLISRIKKSGPNEHDRLEDDAYDGYRYFMAVEHGHRIIYTVSEDRICIEQIESR